MDGCDVRSTKTDDDVKEGTIRNSYKVDKDILNALHSVSLELVKHLELI